MRNRLLVVFAVAATVGIGAASIGAQHRFDTTSVQSEIAQVAAQYPAIVAEVNGAEISGHELAIREYLVRQNTPALNVKDAREVAIQSLIEERVLLEAATREKLWVSEAEVLSAIAELQAMAAKDQELRDAFRATAKQLGVPEEAVTNDKRVIGLYQQAFTLGRIRDHIADSLPAEKRMDSTAIKEAIDKHVASQRPEVRMRIQLR